MVKRSTALSRLSDVLEGLEPADDVPWMARPARLEALAAILRFTKLPVSWQWRPAEWPVWNHEIKRALRDHLWWASAAFLDLDDAIQGLSP